MKNKTSFLSILLAYYLPYRPLDNGEIEFCWLMFREHTFTYLRRNSATALILLASSYALKDLGYEMVGTVTFLVSCVFGLTTGIFISQHMDNQQGR